jgi:GH15 family glucan-1,4-alpha-glucosidase
VWQICIYQNLSGSSPHRSIWEVRSQKQVLNPKLLSSEENLTNYGQNFTYSKIQLWVALDRALRLADKRNLPCSNRLEWMKIRDAIYEEIMERAWNEEMQVYPS